MKNPGIYPLTFSRAAFATEAQPYVADPALARLLEFFADKGLAALKAEDRQETWYADWLAYQKQHGIYASLLSPAAYSTRGHAFNLSKLMRFMEAFGYCSPAHGYSLQVSFLGIFPILRSSNEALKKEAVRTLEEGGVFAFGLSEKEHGSDVYANEFMLREQPDGRFAATGKKYYIGNANCAQMISVLARTTNDAPPQSREPFVFFALRPAQVRGGIAPQKIRTMGVRSAFVGAFSVNDHAVVKEDFISQGNEAWDAIFGTVNLGKFFLGFGSIGIAERALDEAITHTRGRILFGKPVAAMPHIASTLLEAYARLWSMKLYAYRALDYVQAASATDRRYLLFNSVQKAKVGTEGVRVVQLLGECVNARGFECDTFFETALRDIQLIPGLEGSTHINYGITAQFLKAYFFSPEACPAVPAVSAGAPEHENPYLFTATTGKIRTVSFPRFDAAFVALGDIANVRIFLAQLKALRLFALALSRRPALLQDADLVMQLGRVLAQVAYAQLIAEHVKLQGLPAGQVHILFHYLVEDLSQAVVRLCASAVLSRFDRVLGGRAIASPRTDVADFAEVAALLRKW